MKNSLEISLFIVEDNSEECEILIEFFKDDPIVKLCGISNDGLDGLKKIYEQKPDVVITDFIVPRLDGLGLLKEIKNSSVKDTTKVIVMSGVGDNKIVDSALEHHADYFVKKPISLSGLSQTIISVYQNTQWSKKFADKRVSLLDIKKLVRELGIPLNLLGYNYTVKAIEEMLKVDHVKSLGEIYLSISKASFTSIECVEAAIRNAARKSADCSGEKYELLFSGLKGKHPSNSTFLNTIKEYLIMNLH